MPPAALDLIMPEAGAMPAQSLFRNDPQHRRKRRSPHRGGRACRARSPCRRVPPRPSAETTLLDTPSRYSAAISPIVVALSIWICSPMPPIPTMSGLGLVSRVTLSRRHEDSKGQRQSGCSKTIMVGIRSRPLHWTKTSPLEVTDGRGPLGAILIAARSRRSQRKGRLDGHQHDHPARSSNPA
jgi:hypothetical protein